MDMDNIDVDMDIDNRHGALYVKPCIYIFMVCMVCVRVMSLVRSFVRPSIYSDAIQPRMKRRVDV